MLSIGEEKVKRRIYKYLSDMNCKSWAFQVPIEEFIEVSKKVIYSEDKTQAAYYNGFSSNDLYFFKKFWEKIPTLNMLGFSAHTEEDYEVVSYIYLIWHFLRHLNHVEFNLKLPIKNSIIVFWSMLISNIECKDFKDNTGFLEFSSKHKDLQKHFDINFGITQFYNAFSKTNDGKKLSQLDNNNANIELRKQLFRGSTKMTLHPTFYQAYDLFWDVFSLEKRIMDYHIGNFENFLKIKRKNLPGTIGLSNDLDNPPPPPDGSGLYESRKISIKHYHQLL